MKKQQGFTLMELMIAVALVAIIAAFAMPAYKGYAQRSARAAVQADLVADATTMERLKAQNFTYAGATTGTTFPAISPRDATAGMQKYDITLIYLKSDGTVAASGDPIAGFEVQALSTNKLDPSLTEALKIDHLGRKCYKALGASVTSCTIGTDPTWP